VTFGGGIENYRRSDGVWDSIRNAWVRSGSTLYDTLGLLQLSVNDSAISTLRVKHDSVDITITHEPIRLVWFDTTTNTYANLSITRTYGAPVVTGNLLRWVDFWPGVDWAVQHQKSDVEHAVIFKPIFLDTVVARYDRRSDTASLAIGNVVRYVLAGVDSADTVNRTVTRRQLKRIGDMVFSLDDQHLQWVGSDTSRAELPMVKQRWVKVGAILYCIEYVMASDLKRFHLALPGQALFHNVTFTIGGGTAPEADAAYLSFNVKGTNYGTATTIYFGGDSATIGFTHTIINWSSLRDSLFGNTVTSCSLFVWPISNANTDGLYACYQIRPERDWTEGGVTWNDYKASTAWTIGGGRSTTNDIYSTAVGGLVEAELAAGAYRGFDITSIATDWDDVYTRNCRGVIIKQFGGTDYTQISIASDDNATTTHRPKIKVIYTAGSSTSSWRGKIAYSADDCWAERTPATSFSITQNPMYIGSTGALDLENSGFRWRGISIPKNATILSAYMTLNAQATATTTGVNVTVRSEASDDANAFTTLADWNARTWGTDSVIWSGIEPWTSGVGYYTPDISAPIQALVNRTGWDTAHAAVLKIMANVPTTNSYRLIKAWDPDSARQAYLSIGYSVAAGGALPARRRRIKEMTWEWPRQDGQRFENMVMDMERVR
jgi:hypothetical protein